MNLYWLLLSVVYTRYVHLLNTYDEHASCYKFSYNDGVINVITVFKIVNYKGYITFCLCLSSSSSSSWAGVAHSVQWAGYGVADQGLIPGRGSDSFFLLSTAPRPTLGPTQPPIKWVPLAISPGVKRPGPSSSEVKNAWNCTSVPPTSSCRGA